MSEEGKLEMALRPGEIPSLGDDSQSSGTLPFFPFFFFILFYLFVLFLFIVSVHNEALGPLTSLNPSPPPRAQAPLRGPAALVTFSSSQPPGRLQSCPQDELVIGWRVFGSQLQGAASVDLF